MSKPPPPPPLPSDTDTRSRKEKRRVKKEAAGVKFHKALLGTLRFAAAAAQSLVIV